jgi:GT2 family glycosyltransferase
MADFDVLIGILTYNDHEMTDKVIESIKRYTRYEGDYRIVVLDDGSREEYKLGLRHVCARHQVPLEEHHENKGIPTSWNHLALYEGHGKPRIVVLLNNDIIIAPDWLRTGVHFVDSNKDYCASACWGFWRPTVDQLSYVLDHASDRRLGINDRLDTAQEMENDPTIHTDGRPGRVMCSLGSDFIFLLEAFEKIGPFDEDMKSFHEESDEFTRAAAEHKLPCWVLPWPKVFHIWGQTFARNPELNHAARMNESRELYKNKWNVPRSFEEFAGRMEITDNQVGCRVCGNATPQRLKDSLAYCCDTCLQAWWNQIQRCCFDYTNPLYMTLIPPYPIKWLAPDEEGNLVEHEEMLD